ncbi:hypothetical protein MD484_g8231, partial [Candolleomyces efflorescens]
MKIRILNDIKENRQLYKHAPSKDFGKKILDAAFQQCFISGSMDQWPAHGSVLTLVGPETQQSRGIKAEI